MREIKFRAWIPKGSDGRPQIFYQKDQYLGSFLRRANFFASEMEHDKYGVSAEPPKLILLQFTGLNDKNGKEIYEGDIVRVGDEIWEIAWYHLSAGFWLSKNGIPARDWNWLNGGDQVYWHKEPDITKKFVVEVIGNIYENPELLK